MKKVVIALVMFSGLAFAGPGKVATYPLFHPFKTVHAIGHAVKALLW